ncbi:MAG TPA: UbiA family prenyltransferase [Thermoanaerobaculia bacterium]|nr:UbiA family prenyltransferase [Thermoanaerobaculia bacterium]
MLFSGAIRAGEWWEYKIAPALAAFYGTLWLVRTPLFASWRDAVVLIVALAAEAAYVSVLNDLTDRADDRAAGKTLRSVSPLVLVATLIAGASIAYLWRHDATLVLVYAGGWIAFSLYSLPPFRLKRRGFAGVMCDAAGAHLFPAMTAVLLATRQHHLVWLAAVAAWSFASGVRNILWHQLRDRESDVRANVGTFVVRRGVGAATRVARQIAFPLQLLALAVMLWRLSSIWPVAALALYALLMALRPYRFGVRARIVAAEPRSFVVLNEYDEGYLPAAILLASALLHHPDFIVLALHLALFPRHTLQNVRELGGLLLLRRHARDRA